MTDEQAAFVKRLYEEQSKLRQVARKLITDENMLRLSKEESRLIGFYV